MAKKLNGYALWRHKKKGTIYRILTVGLLEKTYRWWTDGVREMTEAEFLAPLGPRGGFYADQPMAQLVLHLNRETMHHGGEIGVLRDLYRARFS